MKSAEEKTYLDKDEVSAILGVGESKAYEVIRTLNAELKAKGFITVRGKINRKYFNEKYYQ